MVLYYCKPKAVSGMKGRNSVVCKWCGESCLVCSLLWVFVLCYCGEWYDVLILFSSAVGHVRTRQYRGQNDPKPTAVIDLDKYKVH